MRILTFFSIYLLSFCLIPVSSTQAEIKTAWKVGPRWDHLEWTIAPFRRAGFIGSELVFDSTSLFTEGVVTWSDPSHPWFLEGRGGFGQVLSGSGTDSDFFTPGRTNLFSESEFDLDGHNILSFGVDGGYRVWEDNYFTVYLLGGFAWNQTRYQMVDGVQTQDPFGLFGLGLSLILIQNIELDGMVLPWDSISSASHLSRCDLLFNWRDGFGPICGMKAKGCGTCGLILHKTQALLTKPMALGGTSKLRYGTFLRLVLSSKQGIPAYSCAQMMAQIGNFARTELRRRLTC